VSHLLGHGSFFRGWRLVDTNARADNTRPAAQALKQDLRVH